jgi:pimeloyl-ACP methyl ester carboxylesterase
MARAWPRRPATTRDRCSCSADGDPVLPPETGRRFAAALARADPEIVPAASHFLQEDASERVGRRIAGWLGEGERAPA